MKKKERPSLRKFFFWWNGASLFKTPSIFECRVWTIALGFALISSLCLYNFTCNWNCWLHEWYHSKIHPFCSPSISNFFHHLNKFFFLFFLFSILSFTITKYKMGNGVHFPQKFWLTLSICCLLGNMALDLVMSYQPNGYLCVNTGSMSIKRPNTKLLMSRSTRQISKILTPSSTHLFILEDGRKRFSLRTSQPHHCLTSRKKRQIHYIN